MSSRGRVPNVTRAGSDVYIYNNIALDKLYEDEEVIVVVAPNEDQLKDIILQLLREKPRTVKEIHEILSGLASEDKIRYALNKLAEEGRVENDDEGRYYAYYL
ncbi:MAG: ArsR family transcriptional regulator [Thermoproteota archaeon]